MLVYQEEYGADADGHRGIIQTIAELEPRDSDEVREQIAAQYEFGVYTYTIYMYDHLDNEHEFEVDIDDEAAGNIFTVQDVLDYIENIKNHRS